MSDVEDAVRAALARIVDPAAGQDIVASGLVSSVSVSGGAARVILEVEPARAASLAPLAKAAEAALAAAPGVASAQVLVTAHSETPRAAPPPPDLGRGKGQPLRPPPTKEGPIPGVDRLIAIGSGKGGVGKSTVSANLAVALAQAGRRVGLLDADVYGPSQPRMLGLTDRPTIDAEKRIAPLRAHGVTAMSIGLLTDADKAVIWRGPMLMSALTQMLRQVAWGSLDALLVDLPPGTGDVQLTLAQRAEVTGAIVVSTPQDVALIDARKAIDMFQRTETPILGLIENMASFACPACGVETPIFGRGGARAEAERLGAPFLGEIPIDLSIRLAGDAGAPVVAAAPDSAPAARFHEIAAGLIERGLA